MLELKIRWISKLWWCCNMVSGTVTQIDREGERERKWRGGMGLRGLAPTWAQNVEGGVRVRGRAEGVKSTGVIHTLLHLAVILAGGNYNVRFIRTHYSATTCSLDHTCCHSLTWSNRSISWDMFCPHASWITTFPLPRTRWLATKCHQLSRVGVCVCVCVCVCVQNDCFFVSNVQVCFTRLLWKVKIKAERTGKKKKSLSSSLQRNGKRKGFFSSLRFSHWVTQFHAPLAYLGWRAMKSVQFWDFGGTVFWNLPRYVVILLSPPLDRLHYYVTVAKVKTVVMVRSLHRWSVF